MSTTPRQKRVAVWTFPDRPTIFNRFDLCKGPPGQRPAVQAPADVGRYSIGGQWPRITLSPTRTQRRSPSLRKSAFILALFLLVAAGYDDDARLAFFTVEAQGSEFLVTWEADLEEGVRTYALQRRTASSGSEFVSVEDVAAQGAGVLYSVRDNKVFKATDLVYYRLDVVYESGARQVLVTKSVNFTPTAIRRTWGSIKAMF